MKNQLFSLILFQCFLVIIFSILFGLFSTTQSGYSSFVGGMIAILPSFLYAIKIIFEKDKDIRKVLQTHYYGMFLKYISTFVLFALTFTYLENYKIIPLMTTYITILLSYLIMLIVFRKV